MSKLLSELAWCADEAKRLLDAQKERTRKFQRAAALARAGKKDTDEFKQLKHYIDQPTVIDFGNVIERLAACSGKIPKGEK